MTPATLRGHTSLLAVLFLLAACAGGPRAGSPSGDRDVITRDQLDEWDVRTTAREVIQRLHPAWLQSRGATSVQSNPRLKVYVNSTSTLDTEALDRYLTSEIREIRYLSGIAASTRYGSDHGAGVILITLR